MSSNAKINFRTDSWYDADQRRYLVEGNMNAVHLPDIPADADAEKARLFDFPEALPGDIWRIQWHGGAFAGYAICCPRCKHVHQWTTANNCHEGEIEGVCKHSRSSNGGELGSCWKWEGSAEDGTLSALPSLHCSGGCGWHGWLRNGEMKEC